MKSYNDMVSICISHKNRAMVKTEDGLELTPLLKCISSIQSNFYWLDYEIVIADFQSTDFDLEAWIVENLEKDTEVRLITVDGEFSRGKGRNIAARHAHGDILFFLDADMIIMNDGVISTGLDIVDKCGAYFPICRSFYDHQNNHSWARTTGFGNLVIGKSEFYKYGKAWEEKTSWGGEDDKMFMAIARNMEVYRTIPEGFYHQWHPEEKKCVSKKANWFSRIFRGKR